MLKHFFNVEFWAVLAICVLAAIVAASAADPGFVITKSEPVGFVVTKSATPCDCPVCDCGSVCRCANPSVLVPRAHEAVRDKVGFSEVQCANGQCLSRPAAKSKSGRQAVQGCSNGQCGGTVQRRGWLGRRR
jgi:hypothetical protein